MGIKIIREPLAQPIDVAEARLQVTQDITDDDSLLKGAIGAARAQAERITKRQFVAARYLQTRDRFYPGTRPYVAMLANNCAEIILERSPVLQVVSVKYTDFNGTVVTVDPSVYIVDTISEPPRIGLRFGRFWQPSIPEINSVEITYDAGYAAPIVADAVADTLTIKGPWITQVVGDVVRFSNSGGALPAPLQPDTEYYVVSVAGADIQLSTTLGGAVLDLTTTGTGTSFIGAVPEEVKAWCRLRIGSLYAHREDTVGMERGQIDTLGFADRLLDSVTVHYH